MYLASFPKNIFFGTTSLSSFFFIKKRRKGTTRFSLKKKRGKVKLDFGFGNIRQT
jgi:hypothetical protein